VAVISIVGDSEDRHPIEERGDAVQTPRVVVIPDLEIATPGSMDMGERRQSQDGWRGAEISPLWLPILVEVEEDVDSAMQAVPGVELAMGWARGEIDRQPGRVTHIIVDEQEAACGDADDVRAGPLQLILRDLHRDQVTDARQALQEADELIVGDEGLERSRPGTGKGMKKQERRRARALLFRPIVKGQPILSRAAIGCLLWSDPPRQGHLGE
jgi:hypothetical protein